MKKDFERCILFGILFALRDNFSLKQKFENKKCIQILKMCKIFELNKFIKIKNLPAILKDQSI